RLQEQRELYRKRLGELNDTVWEERALLAEVDRVAKLAPKTSPDVLEKQRSIIRNHPAQLRAALAEPAPEWIETANQPVSPCNGMRSDLQSDFQTTWGDLATMAPGVGTFTFNMSLDGVPLPQATWFGMAGTDPTMGPDSLLRMMGILPDGRLLWLQFTMPAVTVTPGVQPFHGFESWGTLSIIEGQSFRFLGAVSDGAITFNQAATQPNAPVVGSIAGRLLQFGCLNEPTQPVTEPTPVEPAPVEAAN
ncbi:MAG TPA: hypothetical protein VKP30_28940, partial [Polyangiaceae bacterium]|nr:hypothetical protein [Polyangiaceae bacterium]